MSNLTTWINEVLYQELFIYAGGLFPEFEFKEKNGNLISSNKRKLKSGESGDSIGKVLIYGNNPGYMIDYREGSLSMIDYISWRDSLDFWGALKKLAETANLKIPKSQDFNEGAYQKFKERATILEEANSYFTYCLENSPGAENIRSYLNSRGYSNEEIKEMGLGFIPSQEKLFNRLLEIGYKQEQIEEAITIKTDSRIGTSHSLTIPYRSGGSIKGFKFRTIGKELPKYLNSSGLNKSGGFFNISPMRGDKDLLIVEGELDSLHATVKGIKNTVATGGTTISPDQIRDAIKKGAKSFTICFDLEPDREETTIKALNKAIETILEEGVKRIYIATLPDLGGPKTDPDRLLNEKGAQELSRVMNEAKPYFWFQLQTIFNKYRKIAKDNDSVKIWDDLLDEVKETGARIPDPLDRDRFKSLFLSNPGIKELGLSRESLDITVDSLTSSRAKEKQSQELKSILEEVRKLQEKGETIKALELMEAKTGEIKSITAPGLLPPVMSFDALINEIAELKPSFKTGYKALNEFVGFTPGAISLIAGRPSHGKTTFMFNLLLEMSKEYPGETFYFFTYEEPLRNLSVKLLNRITATDLSPAFSSTKELTRPTNYEFLKSYIKAGRSDIKEIEEGKSQLRELIDSQRIKIIDKNYSVEDLYKLIIYLKQRENIGAVFIDYIQRMRTEKNYQNTREEIAHISDKVLQIAKDSFIPIILGAQLNRAAVNKDKRPSLENLKEAGNLEEDANTVLSVWNQYREDKDSLPGEDQGGSPRESLREVDLEITALKNREGESNRSITLFFDTWTGVIRQKAESYFNDRF